MERRREKGKNVKDARSALKPGFWASFFRGFGAFWVSCCGAFWASFCGGNTISLSAQPVIKKDETPIRLIDVHSTIESDKGNICFKASENWDFHVISHTWSLDVRKLSEHIGKHIVTSKEGPEAYNTAFREANFSQEPCYMHLMEFLHLLDGEGVNAIWFDALCINQIDEEEKSKEIRNMGAYYSRSEGCYVISHGLGEGYTLWGKEEHRGLRLPRWFTRVWTFQEFVLPARLSFIVEGLDQRLIALVNGMVSSKSKNGLCRCFLSRPRPGEVEQSSPIANRARLWFFPNEEVLNLKGEGSKLVQKLGPVSQTCASLGVEVSDGDDGIREDSDQDRLEMMSSNLLCSECHSLPMIRKKRAINSGSKSKTYLVDREVYLGVMQAESSMNRVGNKELMAVISLYMSVVGKRSSYWRPRDVIIEVRKRDCSREEDRVLSILGLLGVEFSQLRTGKDLQRQLAEVAKVCSSEVLVDMCAMDDKPCYTLGMSWAPDFRASEHDDFFGTYVQNVVNEEPMEVEVEKQGVTAVGSIKLLAKVVSGYVFPITMLPPTVTETSSFQQCFLNGSQPPTHFIVLPMSQCNDTKLPQEMAVPASHSCSLPQFSQQVSLESCCLIPLNLKATKENSGSALMLNFELNWRVSYDGSLQLPVTLTHSFPDMKHLAVSFQVQMVLLGRARTTDIQTFRVIMVCLSNASGDEGEELHKIGMLRLIESAEKESWDMKLKHFEAVGRRRCMVGGFGADLSRYVKIEHDIKLGHPRRELRKKVKTTQLPESM